MSNTHISASSLSHRPPASGALEPGVHEFTDFLLSSKSASPTPSSSVQRSDVARIERLELFDETEEWHLMSAHYCIAIAVNELKAISRGGAGAAAGAAAPAAAAAPPTASPTDLAAAVVHAHEERVSALRSAGGASPVARSRARSIARSDADMDFAAATAAAAAAAGLSHHSSGGSLPPSSPGHASSAHGERGRACYVVLVHG